MGESLQGRVVETEIIISQYPKVNVKLKLQDGICVLIILCKKNIQLFRNSPHFNRKMT